MTQASNQSSLLASTFLQDRPDKLFGDDLVDAEIVRWYESEENGYADLGYVDSETDFYPYHAMNLRYGWRNIGTKLGKTLSLGGAFGAEFEKVADGIESLTIIEPGKKFWRSEAFGLSLDYRMPNIDGRIDAPDGSFDTVTAFGVLHHIPNVSFVFSELCRVLKPGGKLLIREPIISMGDWQQPRPGLTKNERGIPPAVFNRLIDKHGVRKISENRIVFSPLQKLCVLARINFWSASVLWLDGLVCKLFDGNHKYHRSTTWDRFAPSAVFLVLEKAPV